MLSFAGGLVLVAALLHAIWNVMLHGNIDRSLSMAWMSISISVVATIAVVLTPWPTHAAWPYILASGLVHNIYNATLIRSYRRNDLGQGYPIARGSSPLLVTLGAALFAHEAISLIHVLGVMMVSIGIIMIALQGRGVSIAGALAAFINGSTIALYTVIDGIGVRLSDGQLTYAAWVFFFYWITPVMFVAMRGFGALWNSVRETPTAVRSSLVGGLVSIGAYGIVIWALQSGAMGAVSALRETSVVFAVLLGRLFLREVVTINRWIACLIVAAGAVCLGL